LIHIAAAANDPEAERWLDEPAHSGPPRMPEEIADIWRSGEAAPLIIADAASDEAAGMINLQFRSDVSVAYRIFPAWRGHGFAARGLELVTRWALEERALGSLVLEIDEGNAASIRVAERCNFRRDGWTTQGDPRKVVFRTSV